MKLVNYQDSTEMYGQQDIKINKWVFYMWSLREPERQFILQAESFLTTYFLIFLINLRNRLLFGNFMYTIKNVNPFSVHNIHKNS